MFFFFFWKASNSLCCNVIFAYIFPSSSFVFYIPFQVHFSKLWYTSAMSHVELLSRSAFKCIQDFNLGASGGGFISDWIGELPCTVLSHRNCQVLTNLQFYELHESRIGPPLVTLMCNNNVSLRIYISHACGFFFLSFLFLFLFLFYMFQFDNKL